MITRITFRPPPPPGKYSSGKRGIVSATPEHPAAPSTDMPAAPAPAARKNSLRVSALPAFSFTPLKYARLARKANCSRKARCGPAGPRLSARSGWRPRSSATLRACGSRFQHAPFGRCRPKPAAARACRFQEPVRRGVYVAELAVLPRDDRLKAGRSRSDADERQPQAGACRQGA